ncbi:MAG: hypothetical protein RR135_00395 [Oscillospiraceae bacterium]
MLKRHPGGVLHPDGFSVKGCDTASSKVRVTASDAMRGLILILTM